MGKKILVIEDNSKMRHLIKKVLETQKFDNVFEAEDGNQALEILKKDKMDLVLMDLSMPQMHGLDVLKSIREDLKLTNLPVLIVTSEPFAKNKDMAVKYKANGYLLKPFSAKKLHEKLRQLFPDTAA